MERMYNLNQVSELLGMKVRTVRQWVHENKIKAIKIEGSHRWVVAESELRRLRNENED